MLLERGQCWQGSHPIKVEARFDVGMTEEEALTRIATEGSQALHLGHGFHSLAHRSQPLLSQWARTPLCKRPLETTQRTGRKSGGPLRNSC